MKLSTIFKFELIAVLIVSAAYCADTRASDFDLFVGLGVHSEKYNCPEFCFDEGALFILELTYRPYMYTAVKAIHISNLTENEIGYGGNVLSAGFDFKF